MFVNPIIWLRESLINLPKIQIRELGRTTGIFLVWSNVLNWVCWLLQRKFSVKSKLDFHSNIYIYISVINYILVMIPVQEVVYRIGVYGQNLRYYKLYNMLQLVRNKNSQTTFCNSLISLRRKQLNLDLSKWEFRISPWFVHHVLSKFIFIFVNTRLPIYKDET